jgi:hypothetical protein
MNMETVGLQIRTFLRNLFGSRLNAHLEEELMRTRNDYETRLMERERTISDLREQLGQLSAKVDRYELVLLPLASPIGGMFAPKKERPPLMPVADGGGMTWAEIQAEHERQQQLEAEAEKTKQ